VEIGAVYIGLWKPQSCQKQKDNYSTDDIYDQYVLKGNWKPPPLPETILNMFLKFFVYP